ncbi:response regulator transcription factor [Pontiellaceae bacterium B12227]|nr:response regulator transcription factor [Pontiellaceae bacterium B12227]
MDEPIKILIIEDNKPYTKSLQRMIEMSEHMEHIVSFSSAESFADSLKSTSFNEVDVILLDLQLPGKNGFQLIPTLKKEIPDSNILVLTQNDDYRATLEAIRMGVSGYILKDSGIAALRSAIQDVHEGGCVIDAQLSKIVLKTLSAGGDALEDNVLSPREREVLELMAAGYVKKEVADRLSLSYRTVAQYTESIYKKLQVPNIAAAVATAIRKGII